MTWAGILHLGISHIMNSQSSRGCCFLSRILELAQLEQLSEMRRACSLRPAVLCSLGQLTRHQRKRNQYLLMASPDNWNKQDTISSLTELNRANLNRCGQRASGLNCSPLLWIKRRVEPNTWSSNYQYLWIRRPRKSSSNLFKHTIIGGPASRSEPTLSLV